MAIFSETFVDAHFVDNTKSHVSIYYKNRRGQTVTHYMPCTWEHPDFQDLLKLISLEQLEKKVTEAKIQQNKNRNEPLNDVDAIFNFMIDNGNDVKYLFPLKVKILALEEVKSSSMKVKKEIQKTNNIFSLMGILGKVMSGK